MALDVESVSVGGSNPVVSHEMRRSNAALAPQNRVMDQTIKISFAKAKGRLKAP